MTLATETRPAPKRGRKSKSRPDVPDYTHLLHRAAQAADQRLLEALAELGMTPRQFALLHAVATGAGQSQTMLVHRTGVDRSTLAEMVRRLIDRRWIQRRRDPGDTRAYMVELTPAGAEAYARAKPIAARVNADIASMVGTEGDNVDFKLVLNLIIQGEVA